MYYVQLLFFQKYLSTHTNFRQNFIL